MSGMGHREKVRRKQETAALPSTAEASTDDLALRSIGARPSGSMLSSSADWWLGLWTRWWSSACWRACDRATSTLALVAGLATVASYLLLLLMLVLRPPMAYRAGPGQSAFVCQARLRKVTPAPVARQLLRCQAGPLFRLRTSLAATHAALHKCRGAKSLSLRQSA